jgi:hypothetical protein
MLVGEPGPFSWSSGRIAQASNGVLKFDLRAAGVGAGTYTFSVARPAGACNAGTGTVPAGSTCDAGGPWGDYRAGIDASPPVCAADRAWIACSSTSCGLKMQVTADGSIIPRGNQ